ncbi:zinc finger protein 37-like isoform X1 [Spodoptera litura]|uniref:Zinc finger protein 37-like isoform X1 n=2 Tax=Spodoptera litura TaxID=69820 RepID=A0A9J7E0C4_SPOLT|nr:zinc finger protein 37-like isoform X1 [Spodoptera litura]
MSEDKTEVETFFGRCRCCLTYGYLKNMWLEHKYNGNPEIYGEMLAKCFALTWDHSEDSIEQDQICEACIVRLRDAYDFKKVVLDSQEELTRMLEDENHATIKEERLDEQLLAEQGGDDGDDNLSNTETEYITFNNDTMESIKEEAPEMEYTDIEYLEDEVANITKAEDNSMVEDYTKDSADSDSSQSYKPEPAKRKKRPRVSEPEDDDDESGKPKRKWPPKLPKSERHKTYKQYSETDLRKCLDEIRSGALTPADASVQYNIPKKTICAKIKMNSTDVPIDNTTQSKLERRAKRLRKKPTMFKTSALDEKTLKQIECNKVKMKDMNDTKVAKDPIDKNNEVKDFETKIKIALEPVKEFDQVNAEQVRTRYKAIVNDKFKKGTKESVKQEVNEMNKHKDNLKTILHNSNATVIKGYTGHGFYCNYCKEHRRLPSDLKKHNLEAHSLVEDVIKVKYVSDLFIRLDITNLKCSICNLNLDKLEDFTAHLSKIHGKKFHTDIKNYFIPFVLDTDMMQCMICKKDFKHFKLLSEHMCEHYRNFECSLCDRAFINKQCMQTHIYRHRKGVFKCSHCPKVFDSRPKKSVHERVVHALSSKTRKCSFCSERFGTTDLVQAHEVKKHGVKPLVFSCQACNKSYNSQSSLLTHRKRYHLMLRPHKCSYCEMAFFSKIELRSHTVTHTKTRDFQCDMCSKSFGTKCSLSQHVRGHLDDRRFKCDRCERSFVHRTAWKGHMRTIHSTIV